MTSKPFSFELRGLRFLIGIRGEFFGSENTQMGTSLIKSNACYPPGSILCHAGQSRFGFTKSVAVVCVKRMAGQPEIVQAIVEAVTIYVVNYLMRPLSVLHGPNNAVNKIALTFEASNKIELCSVLLFTANNIANASVSACSLVKKMTRLRYVGEACVQFCWRKIVVEFGHLRDLSDRITRFDKVRGCGMFRAFHSLAFIS